MDLLRVLLHVGRMIVHDRRARHRRERPTVGARSILSFYDRTFRWLVFWKSGKCDRSTAHRLGLWRGDLYKSVSKLRGARGGRNRYDRVLTNTVVVVKGIIIITQIVRMIGYQALLVLAVKMRVIRNVGRVVIRGVIGDVLGGSMGILMAEHRVGLSWVLRTVIAGAPWYIGVFR